MASGEHDESPRDGRSPSSIDPLALLGAHQEARDRGVRILSTICGPPGAARAVWGRWLGRREGAGRPWAACVTPPGPELGQAQRALAYAGVPEDGPLLFVPTTEAFVTAFSSARRLSEANPRRPVAVVVEPGAIMQFLRGGGAGEDGHSDLRLALVGGLVVLDRHVESVLDASVLREDERPLYRSDHEAILHKLLIHDAAVTEEFRANATVRGDTRKAYEVDFWCPELALALEVDGGQHVSSAKQRKRDTDRDEDLAAVGIRTIRIHAAEVMSDPTRVLEFVRGEIEMRRRKRRQS